MLPDPQEAPARRFRIVSLDGGGAKSFYTLGVLDELEKNSGKPIHKLFDLIFGASTGSIISVPSVTRDLEHLTACTSFHEE